MRNSLYAKRKEYDVTECSIGLGGNLANTAKCFEDALSNLTDCGVRVCRVSSTVRTQAMGEAAGDDFLNAVAVLETPLPPDEVLTLLHATEHKLGRLRTVHWGPRPVDLDLLLYAEESTDCETLVLPHPGLWYRRFVLQPHAEIAGDWMHPLLGESVQSLFERLQQEPLMLNIVDRDDFSYSLERMKSQLRREFSLARFRLRSTTAHEPTDLKAFARIELTWQSATDHERTQPPNHADRTITVAIDRSAGVETQVLAAVRNLLTAALGTVVAPS
ncbi:MAG: 2-amino-4-hydroxy-6-hydroxymethyldihydropteridine diphosphokinase [Fuerstiella sp.]|nr:2-amino-4-hydroxy-6-hydroxymethyldihydropteridine diphosphokinase [Fuerstiella sp.]